MEKITERIAAYDNSSYTTELSVSEDEVFYVTVFGEGYNTKVEIETMSRDTASKVFASLVMTELSATIA